MKILLGGVPFGCGNIGDEAILSCVVTIFRRNFPEAELTVATAEMERTARKYQVFTAPLYGFDHRYSKRDFRRAIREYDIFVWAGASGLSEYPNIGAMLLETAQSQKVKTVIWQVGMSHELNPEQFRLSGKKLRFAEYLHITDKWEKMLEWRIRDRLLRCVSQCDLVILRDQPSLIELHNSGEFPAASFGADSSILQTACAGRLLPDDNNHRRTIGICMAGNEGLAQFAEAVDFLERLRRELNVRLVFIPMMPADRELMESVRSHLQDPEDTLMVDYTEPEEIQNVAGCCDLLLSSRLQLMVMGLNSLIPGIGIARSTKVANCLNMFGLPSFRSDEYCDFEQVFNESVRCLEDASFADRAAAVRSRMLSRLEQSESRLQEVAELL